MSHTPALARLAASRAARRAPRAENHSDGLAESQRERNRLATIGESPSSSRAAHSSRPMVRSPEGSG